ncbi:MAG: asparaginase [Burkholderiales bacterium]|nr:asparaginase [Burkholderiales bacterium]
MTANPILVEALRGGIAESVHRGALAIVDAEGHVHTAQGDIERPIFPRSAVKALQALPLVASGAAERFGLGDAELALACASHGGEPQHAETALAMLGKAGLGAEALECGTHWPYHEGSQRKLATAGAVPSALHNNCSGKHAGFLCLGCGLAGRRGAADFVRGYTTPEHPVMREVTASLQDATGFDLARTARGTDGCSIPTYAVPLRHLAHAFAKLATGQGLDADRARAARRLREAVARAPQMVAGSGRFDSRVAQQFGERVFCKVGAEGVYCAALPGAGLGVAIKMDDGNTARAAEVTMAAVIERLVPLQGDAEAALIRSLSDVALRNWNGIEVGRLRATDALRRLGAA